MRISGIIQNSCANGPGLRLVVFFQGCYHKCPGCHNEHTHDLLGGYGVNELALAEDIKNDLVNSGLTITGGEPFLQPEAMLVLLEAAKAANKSTWVYTGYTFGEILTAAETSKVLRKILPLIDVLVDGRYEKDLKDENLRYRGSSNQKIINMVTGELLWK